MAIDYTTIYSTKDENEIAVLKRVYSEEGIEFRVKGADDQGEVKTVLVAEEDKSKARELLDQTGFLAMSQTHAPVRRRRPGNKWLFVFLAVFILIIVALAITLFMNAE